MTSNEAETKPKVKETVYGYVLASPFLLFLSMFLLFPLAYEIFMALFNSRLEFVGTEYLRRLLVDPSYVESLLNTALYVGVGVNVKMLLALLLANALNSIDFTGKRLYKALIMIPWVIPVVPSALNFRWMLDADYGIIDQVLHNLGIAPVGWLINPHLALGSVIFIHIWTNLPFWSLILLSGLQSIPVDLYDAVKVDGAGSWQGFRHLTLPLMRRLYLICTVLSTVWTMGDFGIIWALTKGGPANATQIIATNAYRQAFEFGEFGYAASMFLFVLPILGILVILLLRLLRE